MYMAMRVSKSAEAARRNNPYALFVQFNSGRFAMGTQRQRGVRVQSLPSSCSDLEYLVKNVSLRFYRIRISERDNLFN